MSLRQAAVALNYRLPDPDNEAADQLAMLGLIEIEEAPGVNIYKHYQEARITPVGLYIMEYSTRKDTRTLEEIERDIDEDFFNDNYA